HDGGKVVSKVLAERYSLVILDVMLPGLSGMEVLKEIRRQSAIPVLMLTARGDDVDRIVGLELGADDYLPKPFNPRELVARIRAVLRRGRLDGSRIPQAGAYRVGDMVIDPAARHVSTGDTRIDLTTVEFDLLEILAQSSGTAMSRESLVKSVLKRPFSPFDRSLDVHISNLRRKIGTYSDGSERIKTIRGLGYILALPPEDLKP
ncbi:MAG: response regulator transcription factor, partial [Thermovirga sp.]|nr:response regulator transcription factor [Thermovirga sp.]